MNRAESLRIYIVLSSVAGALILAMVWLGTDGTVTPGARVAVGITFIAACALGASMAVRPGWLRRTRKRTGHGPDIAAVDGSRRGRKGHHPDCEHFGAHTIKFGGEVLCGGCTGLILGSILSIAGAICYMIFSLNEPRTVLLALLSSGLLIVALSIIEISLRPRQRHVHVLGNSLLVVGFLLVAIGVLELTGNVVYGLMTVLLSVLWLDARIQLSGWRHGEICSECPEACKAY